MMKLFSTSLNYTNPFNQGLQLSYFPRNMFDVNSYGQAGNLPLAASGPVTRLERRGRYCWKVEDFVYYTPLISASPSYADLTIRIIIEPLTYPGTSNAIFYKGSGPANRELYLSVNGSGNSDVISIGYTNSSPSLSLGMTADNGIYDVFIRRVGSTVTVFVNGVNKGTFSNSGTTSASSELYFGKNTEGGISQLDGYIYGCELWSRGLADADIQELTRQFSLGRKDRFNSVIVFPDELIFETVVFDHTLTYANVYNRSFSDTITFDDTLVQGKSLNISVSSLFSFSDKISRQRVFNISVISKLALSSGEAGKFKEESIDSDVTFSQTIVPARNLASSITFADEVVYETVKALSDNIIFTGLVTYTITKVINVSNSISFKGAGVGFFQSIKNEWWAFEYGGEVG